MTAYHGGTPSVTTTVPVGSCTLPGEVRIAPGQFLPAALVSHTAQDGLYPDNACQAWNITARAGQVITWFQNSSQEFHARKWNKVYSNVTTDLLPWLSKSKLEKKGCQPLEGGKHTIFFKCPQNNFDPYEKWCSLDPPLLIQNITNFYSFHYLFFNTAALLVIITK